MCSRHRWTAASFEEHLCTHPLLRILTQGLVWQLVLDGGASQTFRVMTASAIQDVDGHELQVPDNAFVQIPHPLELDDKLLVGWRRNFH